ncbi:hypothetical protein MPSI1_003353 [Malassezia psittaci]|uniref:RPA43 OB domain-containing protein n=1 Tax=Malassezia psittaci TaxID=1821823 RepID=A0AAF0JFF5_9BASI|nr:hypothetical protein MPSI1_003353 [Malassezia psittaci]
MNGEQTSKAMGALVKMRARMVLPVPPVWMNEPIKSVCEQLDTLVMRFIPHFEGVLLAYSHARFLTQLGGILGDSAFAEAPIAFDALVWRPVIGMPLTGSITLSSPSHVSLLLHDTFNAAISSQHLPAAKYEFVHYDHNETSSRDPSDRSVGYWRHKKTGARLGGDTQTLQFTVISMTVANHMLSLHGSLLKDPYSVAPPRPGSLSFDQALAEIDIPLEAEQPTDQTQDSKPDIAAPRKTRFDSEEASETEETFASHTGQSVHVEDQANDSDAGPDDYQQDTNSDLSGSESDHTDASERADVTEQVTPVRQDQDLAVKKQHKEKRAREKHASLAEQEIAAEIADVNHKASEGKKPKKEKTKKKHSQYHIDEKSKRDKKKRKNDQDSDDVASEKRHKSKKSKKSTSSET